jgi:hypothetical protein
VALPMARDRRWDRVRSRAYSLARRSSLRGCARQAVHRNRRAPCAARLALPRTERAESMNTPLQHHSDVPSGVARLSGPIHSRVFQRQHARLSHLLSSFPPGTRMRVVSLICSSVNNPGQVGYHFCGCHNHIPQAANCLHESRESLDCPGSMSFSVKAMKAQYRPAVVRNCAAEVPDDPHIVGLAHCPASEFKKIEVF